jgi:RimJ/RimL family protein N-acetyltransferase
VIHRLCDRSSGFFSETLRGHRLVLRPYAEERDFDNVAAIFSDPRVTGPIGLPEPRPFLKHLREAKRDRAMSPDVGDWTVFAVSPDNGSEKIFAGEVGIGSWEPESKVVELFSAIDASQAGKGYGTEAVSVLMQYIFRHDELATIRMQTLATNERALSLCRKLGYRETGRRYMEPDPGLGFIGGIAVILDCRGYEFKPCQHLFESAP